MGNTCKSMADSCQCMTKVVSFQLIKINEKKKKVCVSLLIFCLVDLSIGVSGVLKSPTIIVLLLISSFILVSICLTYCGAPMLGAYIFIIVISSS